MNWVKFEKRRMNNLLLDTNLLVYAIDIDSSFFSEIQTFLDSENKFYVTSKNLSEFIAVVTRFPKGNPPLPLT